MAKDTKQILLVRLAIYLAVYRDFIGIQNNSKHFDINRLSEDVVAGLLTHLGGWGPMTVLEYEKGNHVAIDLVSEDKTVGVQVTSDKSSTKVAETLSKFNGMSPRPKQLYMVMLRGRQAKYGGQELDDAIAASTIKFVSQQHVLDLDSLHKMAKARDADSIERAIACMEEALGSWAVAILSQHRSSAERLLKVLKAHGLSAQQIFEWLGVPRPYELADAHDRNFIGSILTADMLHRSAEEFRVPLDWLSDGEAALGQACGPCAWRDAAGVAGLFGRLLQEPGATVDLYVVTPAPEQPGDKDILSLDGDQGIAREESRYPILAFARMQGKYGRVYEHLGIQPGESEKYRKAACFLVAYAWMHRERAITGFHINCIWEQWPRAEILATTRTRLLVDSRTAIDIGHHQHAQQYPTFSDGRMRFPDHPGWDDAFEKDYLPLLDRSLTRLEREMMRDPLEEMKVAYLTGLEALPAGSGKSIRLFGGTAIELAAKWDMPVNVAQPCGDDPSRYAAPQPIGAADAASLMDSRYGSARDAEEKIDVRVPIFYIDVVPERP